MTTGRSGPARSASLRWYSHPSTSSAASWSPSGCSRCTRRRNEPRAMNANIAAVLYLVAGVLFIMALRGLSSPESSRRGNMLGIIGMAIAIATTLAGHPPHGIGSSILSVAGLVLGGGIGAVIARRVPMTSMPELVAAFHSLAGLAALLVARAGVFGATRVHPA